MPTITDYLIRSYTTERGFMQKTRQNRCAYRELGKPGLERSANDEFGASNRIQMAVIYWHSPPHTQNCYQNAGLSQRFGF